MKIDVNNINIWQKVGSFFNRLDISPLPQPSPPKKRKKKYIYIYIKEDMAWGI